MKRDSSGKEGMMMPCFEYIEGNLTRFQAENLQNVQTMRFFSEKLRKSMG